MFAIREKTQNSFLFLVFLTTTYLSYIFGVLYYVSPTGPDYYYYEKYFKYFYGQVIRTDLEQGLLYYFSTSFVNVFRSEYLNSKNNLEFISNSIQTTNFIYYLMGVIGIGFLLKSLKFKTSIVLVVMTLLNFFPPLYEMRLYYKPEIIIFPTLVWSLIFLNNYIETQEVKYLILTIAPLSIIFTSKANTALMVGIYLCLFYLKRIYIINKKNFFTSFSLLALVVLLISVENYLANGLLLHQHNLPREFANKADLKFLYNLDIHSLYTNPFRHTQKNSFIGITLLDTFNDYFTISWNDDSSVFFLDSVKILSGKLKPFISVLLTTGMYAVFSYKLLSKDKKKYYYAAPFIGIFLQMILSQFTGYNPETGDIAKTYYYAFLLVIPFSLLIAENLKKNFKVSIIIGLLFCIGMSHIIGFPKIENESRDDFVSFNNQVSIFCKINDFISISDKSNCLELRNYCEFTYKPIRKIVIGNSEYYDQLIQIEIPDLQFYKDNNSANSTTFEKCEELIKNGWELQKINQVKNYPQANVAVLIIFCISIAFVMFQILNKKK